MASGDFGFKKFAEQGFYKIINERIVELAEVGPGQRIIDLACGPGAVTRVILDRLRGARDSVVIGVDHSATAIKQAIEELGNVRNGMVQFIQSRIEMLSEAVKESVDTIIFANAIHYIQDKGALLSEISKTLRPGGIFVFNTSFFDGFNPPESDQFYRRWMFKTLRLLKSEYGLSPVRGEKVEARKRLSVDGYKELLAQEGFQVAKQQVHTVKVPLEGWLYISQFEDFISGAMPGIPLDKASECLKKTAAQTFHELSLKFVPRNWLEVVAVRI